MAAITIVICSRYESIDKILLENLRVTVGCDYELIFIDNSKNEYSIFEAYNLGIQKSRYPFLLFLHEDVLFHTQEWGRILLNYFENNPKVGLIGIAGSKLKTKIPSGWWENGNENLVMKLIQHRPGNKVKLFDLGFKKESFSEVVVIDGVFMAIRKIEKLKFNEKIKGFHNYDQSISLDIREKGYTVFVTNKILLEHFSNGSLNSDWIKSSVLFHKLYDGNLPQAIGATENIHRLKINNCHKFFLRCMKAGNRKMAVKYWFKFWRLKFSLMKRRFFDCFRRHLFFSIKQNISN